MRRSLFSAVVAAVALTGLLAVAGCDQTEPQSPSSDSRSSAESRPSAEPSPTAGSGQFASGSPDQGTTAPAPDGYQYVDVQGSGLRLALPSDWSSVDFSLVTSNPEAQARMADIASRMHMTVEQLLSTADMDLMAANATATKNVNVTRIAGRFTSGTAAQVEAQLPMVGATQITTRQVSTAAGDAVVADYAISASGVTFRQNQIYLQAPASSSQLSVITTTGLSQDQIAPVVDVILTTVETI